MSSNRGRRGGWTTERRDLLIRSWSLPMADLEKLFGLTRSAIQKEASKLRAIGFYLPKKTGSIADGTPKPKPKPARPVAEQQPWDRGWIGSPEYRARLIAGR